MGARGASAVIKEFPLTAKSSPGTITLGPDGAMWFTEEGRNRIGRLTPTGSLSEFLIPTAQATPGGITVGPDGNIWFVETKASKIARILPATGQITEFQTAAAGVGIVSGSDGNLWMVATSANKIVVVSTAGLVLNTFTVSTANALPHGPRLGPDGNIYFAEQNGNKIGRVTPSGRFTEWRLPQAASKPAVTAFGADGRLYFTENVGNRIGRLDVTTGSIAEFQLPTSNAAPWASRPAPRQPLVYRDPDQPDRSNNDSRGHHRIPDSSVGIDPETHRERPRRQPLVHARHRQRDRCDYAPRTTFGAGEHGGAVDQRQPQRRQPTDRQPGQLERQPFTNLRLQLEPLRQRRR